MRAFANFFFSYLPFRIPQGWHDVIILTSVTFTVTNVGYYRRTKSNLLEQILLFGTFPIWGYGRTVLKLFEMFDLYKLIDESPHLIGIRPYMGRIRLFGERIKPYFSKVLALTAVWEKKLKIPDQAVSLLHAISQNPLMTGHRYVANTVGCFLMTFCLAFIMAALFLIPELVPGFSFFPMMGSIALLVGIFVAWRWVLFTLSAFLFVLLVNEIYLHWLV